MPGTFIEIPELADAYQGSLPKLIPEYSGIRIAHGVITEGGRTLRMSGWPALGPNGIIGVGDMGKQMTVALGYCLRTVEAAGATWDDVVHLLIYFTDREKYWRQGVPARQAFIEQHSKTRRNPCITAIGTSGLMHPDMLIEIEATAVF